MERLSRPNIGSHWLGEALSCRDHLRAEVIRAEQGERAYRVRKAEQRVKQARAITLQAKLEHPLFESTDFDEQGRLTNCMSVMERLDPTIRFSPFEKYRGYLELCEPTKPSRPVSLPVPEASGNDAEFTRASSHRSYK